MNRHTTLEQYLTKRRTQNASYNTGGSYSQQPTTYPTGNPDPMSQNHDLWETNFFNAKRECLDELARIKDNITNEEQYITKWLGSYETNVMLMMDNEYQKIKQEIITFLDNGHTQNKRRLKESFKGFGGQTTSQIETIRGKLANVKHRIEQLQQELQNGASYKRGIIDVVGSNFEGQRDQIVSGLAEALNHYENSVYLKVDATRFNRMKEDAMSLFFIDANHANQGNQFNQNNHAYQSNQGNYGGRQGQNSHMLMNPPDGSMRFTYTKVPSACTNTPNSILGTQMYKIVNGSSKWNNQSFVEPPKKSSCC